MVLLAFDDTDSLGGGCTTHAAYEFVKRLEGVDLIGPPRLVRLNPTIPHKTRGNGALCLRLGHGRGRPETIGADGDRLLLAFPQGDELTDHEAGRLFEEAERHIGSQARLESETTHPGLGLFSRPPAGLYEAAVSRFVGQAEAERLWRPAAIRVASWKRGRGLLGAAAAAAWPAQRVTYEWIAYRHPARWGSKRSLRREIGRELDMNHPSTFDNYDPRHDHLRIAPASPCPILAGVRGTDPRDLPGAIARLGPEVPAGGLLFATNQASDDQFRPATVAGVRPFTSPVLTLRIVAPARTWPGGHAFVRAADTTGEIELAAFEPTKEFRHALRRLRPRDGIRAWGSIQSDPGLLALERLQLLDSAPRWSRVVPRCDACDRKMKNRGRGDLYECVRCGRQGSASHVQADSSPAETWEVPVCIRRHLTRPLGLDALAPPLETH